MGTNASLAAHILLRSPLGLDMRSTNHSDMKDVSSKYSIPWSADGVRTGYRGHTETSLAVTRISPVNRGLESLVGYSPPYLRHHTIWGPGVIEYPLLKRQQHKRNKPLAGNEKSISTGGIAVIVHSAASAPTDAVRSFIVNIKVRGGTYMSIKAARLKLQSPGIRHFSSSLEASRLTIPILPSSGRVSVSEEAITPQSLVSFS